MTLMYLWLHSAVTMRLRLHSDSLYVATCMRLHSDTPNEAQATQRHTAAM